MSAKKQSFPRPKLRSIKSLYYITHIDNVRSILERGILSHSSMLKENITFKAIYDSQIVSHRQNRYAPDGTSLWDFANLYFQPRNPMLYRVVQEKDKDDVVILGIEPSVLDLPGTCVSTGNAASYQTDILESEEGLRLVKGMWEVIDNQWWREENGSKRKIMAECLVPDRITPEHILTIFTANTRTADRVREVLLPDSHVSVVQEPNMFFQPYSLSKITPNLSLVEGDMFFSQMQTLTISVNTVGVMGKGLASRAKYQFPDVYVVYQDVCKQKTLSMGTPYLYDREASLDSALAENPSTLPNPNDRKWFLLFPTKRHWRENSDIDGIEQGLRWVYENYETQRIDSLAMPALGCGLGGLKWKDVGPLMCRYLSNLNIPVRIYLPHEESTPSEQQTPEFLLR